MFLLLVVVAMPSLAAGDLELQGRAGEVESETFRIEGFDSSFELTAEGMRGAMRIDRITLFDSGEAFENIHVTCQSLRLMTQGVACDAATFDADFPIIGRQRVRGAFVYNSLTETTNVQLSDVAVANGRLHLDLVVHDAGIDASYAGEDLDLGLLLGLAATLTDALVDYSAAGNADVRGTLSLPADGPALIDLDADLRNADIANGAGTIATAGIHGTFSANISRLAGETRFDLSAQSEQGELYIEPVYANFSEGALTFNALDVVTTDFRRFTVSDFQVVQDGLLSASGASSLQFADDNEEPVRISADIEITQSSVAYLYSSLLQVMAAGTVLGDLETAGTVSGRIVIKDNVPHAVRLTLDDVILDDRAGRYAIYGMRGSVDWASDPLAGLPPSKLRWDSGTAYNLIVGGGELDVQLGAFDIELRKPLTLEMMGGALVINELMLKKFGQETATGRLDAELQPVQLGQLSGAFGWPAFSGTLSGRLPLLTLAENTVTVGGTLSARAFDGRLEVSNLSIEQPFGRVPRLRAELAMRDLDLQRITEVFSFGLIQGRLNGDVTGLELQRWSPVAMDLQVYSSEGDRSNRRISQRAVENLASVGGGGATAVLSTGFLQFFDVFAYDEIGFRCVLKNGVCAMSGVGPAKSGPQGQGYYLVKGRGLPRIDVVGYRDTVSWTSLVQQLSAISRSGSPTVN